MPAGPKIQDGNKNVTENLDEKLGRVSINVSLIVFRMKYIVERISFLSASVRPQYVNLVSNLYGMERKRRNSISGKRQENVAPCLDPKPQRLYSPGSELHSFELDRVS